MAGRLAVDDIELDGFMKLLKSSTDQLDGLRKAMNDATVSGLGTDDLDQACEYFQDEWKYGAEEIGEQTQDLAKIVGQNKDSFNEVDKALEAAMKKSRQGTGKGTAKGKEAK